MATKTVSADELAVEIHRIFTEYNDDLDEIVKSEANNVIKTAKAELIKTSPRDTGEYALGWTISTKNYGGIRMYGKVIHNKTHYRLTHLLEFGHVTRNGISRAKENLHVRPTELKYKQIFVDNVERKVKR